jgi:diguanylate cyclase (GGDEF)-like protein
MDSDPEPAEIHRLLARQLRRASLSADELPTDAKSWSRLLNSISEAYKDSDSSRYLTERAFKVVDQEMRVLYDELRSHSAQQLAAERDRLQAVFDSVGTSICVVGADLEVTALNPAAELLISRSEESLLGTPVRDWCRTTGSYSGERSRLLLLGSIERAAPCRFEDMILDLGQPEPVHATVTYRPLEQGEPGSGGVLAISDTTEHKKAQEEVVWSATHDVLTGLINRPMIMELLTANNQMVRQTSSLTGVLTIDLDNFKVLNDSRGQSLGDRLLMSVAQRIQRVSQGRHTLARIGSDEFLLMLPRINDADEAIRLAKATLRALERPFKLGAGESTLTTASIGVAVGDGNLSASELLRNADLALNKCRVEGPGRYVMFDDSMLNSAAAHARQLQHLRSAVAKRELTPLFQPLFDLRTESLMGFEALAHWQSPDGSASPAEFIPIAERHGLIAGIDRSIISQALGFLDQATQKGAGLDLSMSINVSSVTLTQEEIGSDIQGMLSRRRLDPRRVIVEVTETALIEHPQETIEILQHLADAGMRLALDDFGRGYSSLNWVRSFPLDFIKLDQSFIQQVTGEGRERAIVQAMTDLSHALGIRVVAEGIETLNQLVGVREINIDIGQGFHLGHPLVWDQAMELALTWAEAPLNKEGPTLGPVYVASTPAPPISPETYMI